MSKMLPPRNVEISDDAATELYLRVGEKIFGMSFLDLGEARDAARQFNLSGRDVEIYEKKSGKIIERSAGLAAGAQLPPGLRFFMK